MKESVWFLLGVGTAVLFNINTTKIANWIDNLEQLVREVPVINQKEAPKKDIGG